MSEVILISSSMVNMWVRLFSFELGWVCLLLLYSLVVMGISVMVRLKNRVLSINIMVMLGENICLNMCV